jgi:hypothetical protein
MALIRLRYGDYKHKMAEAAVSINRVALRSDAGQIYAFEETWAITGRLQAESAEALTTEIENLEAAYAKQVNKIALQFVDADTDDGVDTAHVMNVADMLGGIEVQQAPSYPDGIGAQYTTFRDYQITVTGQTKPRGGAQTDANSGLVAWEQTVDISGGYPRDVLVQTLNTYPIRQRAAMATPSVVRQYGSASATQGWPFPPDFLYNVFSEAVILENSVTKRGEQTQMVNGIQKGALYTTAWAFAFGLPTPRGFLDVPGPRRPPFIRVSLV